MLVASNQPFYPVYLYVLVGSDAWTSLLTFLSTPFFLAVPALARRNAVAGRAMLPLAGIGNTALCVWLFGTASAVEAFYIPCSIIALLSFGRGEFLYRAILAALPIGCYVAFSSMLPAIRTFTSEQYSSMAWVNIISALSLSAFVLISSARRAPS